LATPTLDPQTFEDRHHFLLRKLHSLSGIVPVGIFLIEHLLTNSLAYHWGPLFDGGPERFNKAVHALHELPFLLALEVFGIFLPLAFHAGYGIKIAMTAEPNTSSYPYMDNRRYFLQRVTGYIAFIFIVIHLMKFRFAHVVGWSEVSFLDPAQTDKFALTQKGLNAWNLWGYQVSALVTYTLYVIGLAASCFHFGNGIWGFCISWGIAVGERAQKRVGAIGAVVGLVLFFWGCASLYAFATTEHESANPPPAVTAESGQDGAPPSPPEPDDMKGTH